MLTKEKREGGWKFALVAILAFLLLAVDVVSVFAAKVLDGRPLSDPAVFGTHWYVTACAFLCSATVWLISAAVIIRWARRRGVLDALFSLRRDRREWLVFGLGVVALVLIARLEASASGWAWLSLVREYRGFERLYPGHGAAVTAFQFLYYLLESSMVVLILAAWQRAGELWTGLRLVPWGGFGLTLTWGAAHFASHPQGALAVVVTALIFGLVFVGVRKSAPLGLATVWLAFIV